MELLWHVRSGIILEGRTGNLVARLAQCPKAALNPETGDFVDKRRIYDVFESTCYDEDPETPWGHLPRSSKDALTDEEIERRLRFGVHMERLNHTAAWYFRHVLWTDVCNDV